MSVRCLYLDIETFPIEAYAWGLWKQNIGLNQIKKPTVMASFAAKWRGNARKIFHSEFHDGHADMIQRAWDLLNEAQVVAHWNGDRFDIKHLNREFVEAGMAPPSPFKSLDLMKVARSQFLFPSNKLQYVSTALGLAGKAETGGFELWLDCMSGDTRAWAKMKKYNIQDVVLLEEIHDRLLPYIKSGPHMGLLSGAEEDSCRSCGGTDLQRRGYAHTDLGKYPQYWCKGCGTWSRGKHAVQMVGAR